MINELSSFTLNAYKKLLLFLISKRKIIPVAEAPSTEPPYVILRHDVDASLESALKMAKIEKDLNIKATYYVLFSHNFYNLLEKDSMKNVRKIYKLNHEIGLHYDIGTYAFYDQDFFNTLDNQIKLLEKIINSKVASISSHNLSIIDRPDPLITSKYINAYNQNLYELYVSDSCRAWCIKDLTRLLSLKDNKIQLLIHPFLWTEDSCERDFVLEKYFNNISIFNDDFKRTWLKIWNNSQKKKMYDKWVKNNGV